MLSLQIFSWIAVGVGLGLGSYYASASRDLSLFEVSAVGAIGAFAGGFWTLLVLPTRTYNGQALVMACVGSLTLLVMDWALRGGRRPRHAHRS